MNHRIRVLLVDDSADIRDLYQRLFDSMKDLQCVGTRESTVDLENAVEQTLAEVAVIDLICPGRNALDAIRSTAALRPDCRIIAFSGHDDAQTYDEALAAGAWSLVSKNGSPYALVDEIRRVRAL